MEKRIIKQEKDIRPHVFLFYTDNGPAVWHNKGYSDMPYGLLHHSIRPSSSLHTAHICIRKRLFHDAKTAFSTKPHDVRRSFNALKSQTFNQAHNILKFEYLHPNGLPYANTASI